MSHLKKIKKAHNKATKHEEKKKGIAHVAAAGAIGGAIAGGIAHAALPKHRAHNLGTTVALGAVRGLGGSIGAHVAHKLIHGKKK